MNDFLVITYRHECGETCSRDGYEFQLKPDCRDGVASVPHLVCLESMQELVEVARKTYPSE